MAFQRPDIKKNTLLLTSAQSCLTLCNLIDCSLPGSSVHEILQVAQMVMNLPAMQETRVQSLSWEDPLKKGMIIHSSVLV